MTDSAVSPQDAYTQAWERLLEAVGELDADQAFVIRRRLSDVQSAQAHRLNEIIGGIESGGGVA